MWDKNNMNNIPVFLADIRQSRTFCFSRCPGLPGAWEAGRGHS